MNQYIIGLQFHIYMQDLDRSKVISLVVGITGIYAIYFAIGIIQEAVIKITYVHDQTGEHQNFDYPESQLLFSAICAYLISTIHNRIKYSPAERACIPWVNGFKSGGAVTVSTISYSYAIKFTNFPVVMMIRSCNILSVVLVGVLFSGVKDTTLKLGRRKIVIAALATSGMIIFKVFDPNTSNSTHETEIIGISLMIASLLADGFLPDFQAVIKSVYKPHAIVMLESVNKWAAILCLTFSIATGHLIPMMTFILSHQKLLVDLLLIGILSSGGQFFVYYLAMVFKQHIVPLIVATRKIFTVGLSILYYNHGISSMQLLGLLLVFGISIYEFKTQSELKKSLPQQSPSPSPNETKKE